MKKHSYMNKKYFRFLILFFLIFTSVNLFIVKKSLSEIITEKNIKKCKIPAIYKSTSPFNGTKPTDFNIKLTIFDFIEIIDSKQTFEIDYLIEFSWLDSRLSKDSLGFSPLECEIRINDIWFPNIIIINQVSTEEKLNYLKINNKGKIKLVKRMQALFSSNFLFTDFPFDNQELKVTATIYESDQKDVRIILKKSDIKTREVFSLEGWNITPLDPIYSNEGGLEIINNFSQVDIRFKGERIRSYYIWKLITPLALIVLMAWAVFWISPALLGPQVSLSTATILTLIAYRFSIGYQLPKIPYFTKMDKFVFASTLIVFMALGIAIFTSYLSTKGKEILAQNIQYTARYIYVLFFILILLISFLI